MAARKNAKANDVNTVEGFIAEFGVQARKLSAHFDWCRNGKQYAHEHAGIDLSNPYARMPMHAIPDEYLSDDGKQEKAAQAGKLLAELREGATRAARYCIESGYPDTDGIVTAAVNALGIPGKFVSDTRYEVGITVTGFTTERISDSDKDDIAGKISEAVTAILDGSSSPVNGKLITSAGSSRYSTTTPTWKEAA